MSGRRDGQERPVLGFLSGLLTAARERLDRTRQRLAAQRAAEAEQLRAEQAARAAELTAQVAATPAEETFVVALGAPYRETFLGELTAAAEQRRPPAYLYGFRLPAEEVESAPKLLQRDFDVTDPPSAVRAVRLLQQHLGTEAGTTTAETDAVLIARGCWLVTAGAGAGLLPPDRVLELSQPFALRAQHTYSSWADFGHHFLAGESKAPDSNALGRRALAKTVAALLGTPGSPWHDRPWPGGAAA